MPDNIRHTLAAHEAGHIYFAERHGKAVKYAFIDDNTDQPFGYTHLTKELQSEEASLEMPASGAAGEIAVFIRETGDEADQRAFIRGLMVRTITDRELFHSNANYDALDIVDQESKNEYFIKYATSNLYKSIISSDYNKFNRIRTNLFIRKYIGRSMLNAIAKDKDPNWINRTLDWLRLPPNVKNQVRPKK